MIQNKKCPICGEAMTETTRGFSCSKWKKEDGGCKFTIWKESYGAIFTEEDAERLLQGDVIQKTNVSKEGKERRVEWFLDEEHKMRFRHIAEN